MTNLYITNQRSIYEFLAENNLNCYLFHSIYDVKIDSPGVVIKTLKIADTTYNICLTEMNGSSINDIDNEIRKHDYVCLVNASSPNEESQFNFDMMLSQLSEKNKISCIKRLWINDVNEIYSLDLVSTGTMRDNSDFKNTSQFYLAKKLIDHYWQNSKITSNDDTKLTLQHYYILALLVSHDNKIAADVQSTYFTLNASYAELKGRLTHFRKFKFSSYEAASQLTSQSSNFLVIKSKYKETSQAKPLLHTISSIVKATSKVENVEHILKSLYEKGLITNPFSKNHTIPSKLVDALIDNMVKYGYRYNHVISHVKTYGISTDQVKQHIINNYVDDYTCSKDRSHAIIPLPSLQLLDLNDDELLVYDLLVLRYFTIFMPNSLKFTKKVEAVSNNNTNLILEKSSALLLGCSVFDSSINKIFQEICIDTEQLKNSLQVGSIIENKSIDYEVKGNVSSTLKEMNETQLLNKLTNMGKKMIPRKLKLRYRNFSIGNATLWRTYIEELEQLNMIVRNDDHTFTLTDKGIKFRNNAKAYLLSIDNLNNWHIDMVKILNEERTVTDVLTNHIAMIKSLESSQSYQKNIMPNYRKIILNNKCLCGAKLKEYDNFIGCTSFPKCKLTIPKKVTSKDTYVLNELDIVELLNKGETTTVIEQFAFKSGNSANIYLRLNEMGKVVYKFINKK